ncbi:DUF2304 family protein [Patescibacteria group bacterium]|nr:DUF2304 family protein [Patescibacteria group bacterium]
MNLFSFFGLIFVIFAWSRAFNRVRTKLMSWREFLFWSVIWCTAVVILIWPSYSTKLASYIGIGRGADVIVYFSLLLIFYLLYRIYAYIDTIERDITKLVRVMAVERQNVKSKKL